MKLAANKIDEYFEKPESNRAGILIYGANPMRVAMRRQQIIANLIGPDGRDEMRLDRMSAGELSKQPAKLHDAIKAHGFFPGQRVVYVEEANDLAAGAVSAALSDWSSGDAHLVVSAGTLRVKSKLRKCFEEHRNAYAAAIYDNPPSPSEIGKILKEAGLSTPESDAMRDIHALAKELDPGDLRQTIEKIAIYKLGDRSPLTSGDVAACAPASTEADMEDMIHMVAESHSDKIGPLMKRLRAQGMQPVGLCLATSRHFKILYTAATDPKGAVSGMDAVRPPVFGPRRNRMIKQVQNWGAPKLEQALVLLTQTDMKLRSAGQTAPQMAVIERTLIRLAMMVRR